MKHTEHQLRPRFTVECFSKQSAGEHGQRFHIALCARGVMTPHHGKVMTLRRLVEGCALSGHKTSWLDESRLVSFPPGMDETDAHAVLSAAFRLLQRGKLFDEGTIIVPIELRQWLDANIPANRAVSVDCAVRRHVGIDDDIVEGQKSLPKTKEKNATC